MLLPLLSAAASAAPIPVAHAATGWRSGVAVKPCLDPRPDAVPLQVMVLYPGEEADAMAEPAGYRRIRTPRAGLYRYRVLNGDAVDVRFCVF